MKQLFYFLLALALPWSVAAQSKTKTGVTKNKTVQVTRTKKVASPNVTSSPVPPPIAKHIDFRPFIDNNMLLINGTFTQSTEYNLWVSDKAGKLIYSTAFKAQGGAYNFDMGKTLPNGEYSITVQEKNNRLASGTINLVRN